MVYRIKDWSSHYENNRTKDMKKMSWVPIPIKLSGDGYTTLMESKDGAGLFGAWIACVEVAASCEIRGTLVRSSGNPHDSKSLSRITRIPENIISKMLNLCTLEINWLEIIDLETGAVIPQEGAASLRKSAVLGNSREGTLGNTREGKGIRKHPFEKSPFYDKEKFSEALPGWSPEKKKLYYEKAKGYSEANGGQYLNWIAAVKNWERKDKSETRQSSRYGRQEVSRDTIRENARKTEELIQADRNDG